MGYLKKYQYLMRVVYIINKKNNNICLSRQICNSRDLSPYQSLRPCLFYILKFIEIAKKLYSVSTKFMLLKIKQYIYFRCICEHGDQLMDHVIFSSISAHYLCLYILVLKYKINRHSHHRPSCFSHACPHSQCCSPYIPHPLFLANPKKKYLTFIKFYKI